MIVGRALLPLPLSQPPFSQPWFSRPWFSQPWVSHPLAFAVAGAASDDDVELVRAARAGDRDAFEQLVLRHQARVFRLAGRFFPRLEDVEEAAQETFLTAWLKLDRYSARAPFEHWLMRVCTNTCLGLLRRHRTSEPLDFEPETRPQPTGAGIDAERLLARLAPADAVVLKLLHGEGGASPRPPSVSAGRAPTSRFALTGRAIGCGNGSKGRSTMATDCDLFRRRLTAGQGADAHARACPACATFADGWSAVESALAGGAEMVPPPGFAVRVRSRLPPRPHPVVALSLRVLPAALTLLAVAGLWTAVAGSVATGAAPSSTDDYLQWMVEEVMADAALLPGEARR